VRTELRERSVTHRSVGDDAGCRIGHDWQRTDDGGELCSIELIEAKLDQEGKVKLSHLRAGIIVAY
jgi:hypothetical protein